MQYLNKKKEAELDGVTNAATSAEQLVASLQKMEGVAFLTVVYEPTEGLLLSMTSTERTKSKKDIKLNPTLYGVDQLLCRGRPELRKLYESSFSSTAPSGKKNVSCWFFFLRHQKS